MQIFIAIDGKPQTFFSPHISNWIYVLRKYFSNYVYLKDLCKNLKEIGIYKLHRSLH